MDKEARIARLHSIAKTALLIVYNVLPMGKHTETAWGTFGGMGSPTGIAVAMLAFTETTMTEERKIISFFLRVD